MEPSHVTHDFILRRNRSIKQSIWNTNLAGETQILAEVKYGEHKIILWVHHTKWWGDRGNVSHRNQASK
jgi:hypothetical protein